MTVKQILRKLAARMTPEEIVRDHPRLTAADVCAAQAFAADYPVDEAVAFG